MVREAGSPVANRDPGRRGPIVAARPCPVTSQRAPWNAEIHGDVEPGELRRGDECLGGGGGGWGWRGVGMAGGGGFPLGPATVDAR